MAWKSDYPMTDPNGAAIYAAPWIPSIYPSHVSIYTPAPWILWVPPTATFLGAYENE